MDTFLFPEPNVPLLNHPHHPFHLPLTGNILRRESPSLSSSGQNVTQHLFLSLNVTRVIRFCVSSMDFFSSSSSSLFFLGVFVVIESDSRHDLLPLLLLFFLSSCSVCLLSFTCLPDEDGSTQWPSYMPQVYLIWDSVSLLSIAFSFSSFSLSLFSIHSFASFFAPSLFLQLPLPSSSFSWFLFHPMLKFSYMFPPKTCATATCSPSFFFFWCLHFIPSVSSVPEMLFKKTESLFTRSREGIEKRSITLNHRLSRLSFTSLFIFFTLSVSVSGSECVGEKKKRRKGIKWFSLRFFAPDSNRDRSLQFFSLLFHWYLILVFLFSTRSFFFFPLNLDPTSMTAVHLVIL